MPVKSQHAAPHHTTLYCSRLRKHQPGPINQWPTNQQSMTRSKFINHQPIATTTANPQSQQQTITTNHTSPSHTTNHSQITKITTQHQSNFANCKSRITTNHRATSQIHHQFTDCVRETTLIHRMSPPGGDIGTGISAPTNHRPPAQIKTSHRSLTQNPTPIINH